jgi:hypothetical protein
MDAKAKAQPLLSEPRQRLAKSIDELAALREERERLRRGGDGWGATRDADAAVTRAEAVLEAAVEADVHRRTLVLAGEAPDDPAWQSVADARRDLQRAQDELAASREAGERIKQRVATVERQVPMAETVVRERARTVLLSECADIRRDLEGRILAFRREYVDLCGALRFLSSAVPHPPEDAARQQQHLSDLASVPVYWPEARGTPPSEASWREAFEALQRDAAAILPEA